MISTRTRAELVGGLLLLALGVGAGRFAAPARVETQVVTVDKVRLQEVIREVQTEQKDVQQEEAGTFEGDEETDVAPDGTKKTFRHGTVVWGKKTQEEERKQLQFSLDRLKTEEHRTEQKTVTVNEQPRLNIFAGAGVAPSLNPLGADPVYVAGVQYRLVGPVSVGAWATFDQVKLQPAAGVLVGLTF